MSFALWWREIRQMIGEALLQTLMSRAIFRKGLGLITGQPSSIPVDVWGQYAHIDALLGGGYSELGSVVTYGAEIPPWDPETRPKGAPTRYLLTDFMFPDGTQRASHKGDWRGVDDVRLLATVTNAGPSDSSLYLEMWIDSEPLIAGVEDAFVPVEISFEGGAPTVPLDEVGLHVSEWHRIEWGAYRPLDPYEQGFDDPDPWPAQIYMRVSNPLSSTDSVGAGLIQIQVRGDLDVL